MRIFLEIAGLGIFAIDFIPSGTLVWNFAPPGLEFNETDHGKLKKFIKSLNKEEKYYFITHAYIFHQAIRLANAASDYMNHNTSANLDTSSDLDTSIANRDIYPGEELFENYYTYGTGPKWWLEMVSLHLATDKPL